MGAYHYSPSTTDSKPAPGDELLKVVGDEDAAHVKLERGLVPVVVSEEVGRRALRNVQQRPELDVTLRAEVHVRCRLLVVALRARVTRDQSSQ